MSIADYHGAYESSCGYCKELNEATNEIERKQKRNCIGMHIHGHLPVNYYEDMMARNWRRSGNFFYQPQNESMCCPQYAIRLDVNRFKPSKHHRKSLKKIEKFLKGDADEKTQKTKSDNPSKKKPFQDLMAQELTTCLRHAVEEILSGNVHDPLISLLDQIKSDVRVNPCLKGKSSDANYTSNIVMMLLGQFKKHYKDQTAPKKPKEIAEYFSSKIISNKNISSISCADNGYINIFVNKPQQKEQDVQSIEPKPIEKNKTKSLTTKFVKSSFDEEEFNIYKKYQTTIHHDDPEEVNRKSYKRFLCTSCLTLPSVAQGSGPFSGYGSYHIQYRLDEVLVGVSVVDVLVKGLSSVYFFYDPDYSHLSLGVYSALQEIKMIAEENQKHPEFEYYYLGFYIHSCAKMKYKAQYKPSQLLCPVTFEWVDLDECTHKLDQSKFCSFSKNAKDEKPAQYKTFLKYDDPRSDVKVLLSNSVYPFKALLRKFELKQELLSRIQEYINTVGEHAFDIIFVIH
ncbi:arginyl tRS [Acrasis kona]|uniref:Arginyl-tRNA--protein transferase 1 n=1 Tax=Acrasis kona TaxID=1008807 RepID=A0AAW2YH56_9EUKA